MANKKYIVGGKVYEETDERKVIVGGKVLEEATTTAGPSGFQAAWAKGANTIINVNSGMQVGQ